MSPRTALIALLGLALPVGLSTGQPGVDQEPEAELRLVGRARISAVYDIDVAYPYAYALERGVLHVLDVQDPSAVREVGALEFEPARARAALRHPYLYLTGFGEPLGVVDVSDPAEPRWVGEWPELTGTWSDVFEIAGGVGYLVKHAEDRPEGERSLQLEVLDLESDPAHPKRLGLVDLGVGFRGEYGGIAQADGRVYLVVERPVDEPTPDAPTRSRLIVVDVREPAEPRLLHNLQLPAELLLKNVEVRGELLYMLVSGPTPGLAVFRLSGGGDLELLGEITDSRLWRPIDLIVHGPAVYVTFKGDIDLVTFDVSDPSAPNISGTHTIPDLWAAGLGMSRVEDRLYVAGDGGPTPILDVSEPLSPRLLGNWPFEGGMVRGIVRVGDLALVANAGGGMFVYDVSEPSAPSRLARRKAATMVGIEDWQWNVVLAARGSRAVVAYETILAELLDLSEPTTPRVLGWHRPRGLVHAVALTETHAFLGYRSVAEGRMPDVHDPTSVSEGGGIEIVDIADPRRPRRTAALDLGKPVTDVAVAGRYVLAASADGGLAVIDPRDPSKPAVVARLEGEGGVEALPLRTTRIASSADGTRVYVAHRDLSPSGEGLAQTGTFSVIDLSQAAAPRRLGQLPLAHRNEREYDIAVRGDQVVLFAGAVMIVDVSDPASPRVVLHEMPAPVRAWWEGTFLDVDDQYLYLGADEDGVWIYRLPEAATAPRTRSSSESSGSADPIAGSRTLAPC